MIKLAVFDMDNTLTESRSLIDADNAKALCSLLETMKVAVISGGSYAQFDRQILQGLNCKDKFDRLFLLPTTGAQIYSWDETTWKRDFYQPFPQDQRQVVVNILAEAAGIGKEDVGKFIEDRETQITYSALGTDAPLDTKASWDPDQKKRRIFVEKVASKLSDFKVTIAGTTSVDVTEKGLDKAFGVKRLAEHLKLSLDEIVFVGDALFPGGNDEPVKAIGVRTLETSGPRQTGDIIRRIKEGRI